MARTVEDFEEFLVPLAPDAPSTILQHAAREAVVAFMRDTRLSIGELIIPTQCGICDYPLITPECRALVQVEQVFIQDCPDPIICDYSGSTPGARGTTSGATRYGFTDGWRVEHIESHNRAVVVPSAGVVGRWLKILYSWAIQRDSCPVPDYIYEDYMDAVKHRAAYELYIMPGQEWTSATLASHHLGMYQMERRRARSHKWTRHSTAPLRFRSRRFI